MKRRTVLSTMVTPALAAMAGCAIDLPGKNMPDEQESDVNLTPPVNGDLMGFAESHLEHVCNQLNKVTIVQEGEIDIEGPRVTNPVPLFDRLIAATEAVNEAREKGHTPAKRIDRTELGISLATSRTSIYANLADLADQENAYVKLIVHGAYYGATAALPWAADRVVDIVDTAHEISDTLEKFDSESITPVEHYQIERVEAERDALVEFESIMGPVLNALEAWPKAIDYASAATTKAEEGEVGTALEKYQSARQLHARAQEEFARVDGLPPLYTDPVRRWNCGLETLETVYRHAEEGVDQRRKGNDEAARRHLEKAKNAEDTYRDQCYSRITNLVPRGDL